MKKFLRSVMPVLTMVLMVAATNASANWGKALKIPFFKAGTVDVSQKAAGFRGYRELPRPKLACYPSSSYRARFGEFSWSSTSAEDADGEQPNPTFRLNRVTDVESLDVDFQIDASDCTNVVAEGYFKVTLPGRGWPNLAWNRLAMPLVDSKEGSSCTFRLSIPMRTVDALIDALPIHASGEIPRIDPDNENLREHYVGFTMRARDTQQDGCQWAQHAYVRLFEESPTAGTMEWDECSWNTDFDPEP